MMLDEHKTPNRFWPDAISTAYYISNRIFRFGRKSSISQTRPFGCKCFILKHDNMNKFDSHSSDGILLGYTPYDKSYRVFNLETNTVVELYDVTFDETTHCPHDVFRCTGDKKWRRASL
jgi:hypothetical protein